MIESAVSNHTVTVSLPDWIEAFLQDKNDPADTVEARMRLAVDLSRENAGRGGGPFGAAVFDEETGKLIAVGVNLVVPAQCSVCHAEIVAIMMAQRALATFDLGGAGQPPCQLVSSTEPCAMCLGAIPWSGVRGLVCGARDEDARRIGMDEGAKPENWVEELQRRGIGVKRDVLRTEAAAVLVDYAEKGGPIYNSRQGQ